MATPLFQRTPDRTQNRPYRLAEPVVSSTAVTEPPRENCEETHVVSSGSATVAQMQMTIEAHQLEEKERARIIAERGAPRSRIERPEERDARHAAKAHRRKLKKIAKASKRRNR